MRFFFPDSQDMIDPSFDFENETRAEFRIRQRDDLYPHEIFDRPPFDGVLVSKAIVDGAGPNKSAKYSLAQRHRLLRLGVRDFFRLDKQPGGRSLVTMGDCGAFSYKDEEYPPFSAAEVIEFYSECGFDFGLSVDHAILLYDASLDNTFAGLDLVPPAVRQRQAITLELADEFKRLHRSNRCDFTPLGVAQGWSPASYAHSVAELQRMGYKYVALGGMVSLKTEDIRAILEHVQTVRNPGTQLHLLGVTRTEHLDFFQRFGAVSFDSTSPFLQAFKDDRDNYHTPKRTYTAVRVPQVEGNPKLMRRIRAGEVDQAAARRLERQCLNALRDYDRGAAAIEEVLEPLRAYEQIHDGNKDRTESYRATLSDRPWKECRCDVCREVGIHVVIFRGSERNKRRGFHNLSVFYQRLHREMGTNSRFSLANSA